MWRAPRVPAGLAGDDDSELSSETIGAVVAGWEHNRRLFPGWIVLPEQLRRELRDHEMSGDLLDASKEERILSEIPRHGLAERLRIVHEVAWRREIRLDPLGKELGLLAKSTVQEVVDRRDQSEVSRTGSPRRTHCRAVLGDAFALRV